MWKGEVFREFLGLPKILRRASLFLLNHLQNVWIIENKLLLTSINFTPKTSNPVASNDCTLMFMANQPTLPSTYPPRNSRPYSGLINPYFGGGYGWFGWLAMKNVKRWVFGEFLGLPTKIQEFGNLLLSFLIYMLLQVSQIISVGHVLWVQMLQTRGPTDGRIGRVLEGICTAKQVWNPFLIVRKSMMSKFSNLEDMFCSISSQWLRWESRVETASIRGWHSILNTAHVYVDLNSTSYSTNSSI